MNGLDLRSSELGKRTGGGGGSGGGEALSWLSEAVPLWGAPLCPPPDLSGTIAVVEVEAQMLHPRPKVDGSALRPALVTWFELDLYDGVRLDTSPLSRTHWRQPVTPLSPEQCAHLDRLEDGSSVRISCEVHDDEYTVSCALVAA